MPEFLLYAAISFATGVLTALGVGGGSLLTLILVAFLGVGQMDAQKVNLLYFAATGFFAVWLHLKNRQVDKKTALFASLGGVPSAILCAVLAGRTPPALLKKGFAVVVLIAAVYLLFSGGNRGKSAK